MGKMRLVPAHENRDTGQVNYDMDALSQDDTATVVGYQAVATFDRKDISDRILMRMLSGFQGDGKSQIVMQELGTDNVRIYEADRIDARIKSGALYMMGIFPTYDIEPMNVLYIDRETPTPITKELKNK